MDKQEYALNKEPVASIYPEVPKCIKLPTPRNANPTLRSSRLDSYVTPSLQQLWDLSFKFTFTGFSSPHPPSSTRWCPWTRKLLSQNTWLIPHSPAIGGCRTALASLQFLPKLLDSSSGQAAHGKEKGWLWNTSAKAQVFTIMDKSEFCSTCLWKFESSTSCYETPWLETQVADLLCTHYIHYSGEKYLLN